MPLLPPADGEATPWTHRVRPVLLAALIAGVVMADSTPTQGPAVPPPAVGVERVVGDEPSETETGNAAVDERDQPAGLGDPEQAVDRAALTALAGPIELDADDRSWFLVGDSTFTAAAEEIGFGSAYPGRGFVLAPLVGEVNRLDLPDADFDGTVVIGVSIWDVGIADATPYVDAVERYRDAGHRVIVVGVPVIYGPLGQPTPTPQETAELRALNDLVAAGLGCELLPWSIRDVETVGHREPVDDFLHPTAVGVTQLLTNLSTAEHETSC
ncbi:MAG: hypothetical protein AAGC53_00955 [Actinomycetota bacterium]